MIPNIVNKIEPQIKKSNEIVDLTVSNKNIIDNIVKNKENSSDVEHSK